MERINAGMMLPDSAITGPENVQGVGLSGGNVIVLFPLQTMTKHQALLHAAWLVAIAEDNDGDFAALLTRVRSS